jgi:hypothetical protein
MKSVLLSLAVSALFVVGAAQAAPAAPPRPDLPEVDIEIYRIAPGEHAEFLKLIAEYDEANREAGVAPRQLYVHQDGADWDFIFIQPHRLTPEQSRRVAEAERRRGSPADADFFFAVRRYIAAHTDTTAVGPITAAQWLARVTPSPPLEFPDTHSAP